MSLPMLTFSLTPSSEAELPLIAASGSALVVSLTEAADSRDSVANDPLLAAVCRLAAGEWKSITLARLVGDRVAAVDGHHDAHARAGAAVERGPPGRACRQGEAGEGQDVCVVLPGAGHDPHDVLRRE